MSRAANVQAVEILAAMEAALARFAGEAEEILLAVEREIKRTQQWLEDRRHHWQRQVERGLAEVEEARRALAACREEEDADCSEEAQALRAARRRLEIARGELASTQRWTVSVKEAIAKYQVEARRLQHLDAVRTEQARALLKRRLAELERYVEAGGTGASLAAGTAGQMATGEYLTVGTPGEDARLHRYQGPENTCAIYAQRGIIEKLTGKPVDADALKAEALRNGWYLQGPLVEGTPLGYASRLLESHGVQVDDDRRGSLDRLRRELEAGNCVVAFLVGPDLWCPDRRPGPPYEFTEGHAVVVTGVDVDPVTGEVRWLWINDSAFEDGAGRKVRAEDFDAAWWHYSPRRYMVATRGMVGGTGNA